MITTTSVLVGKSNSKRAARTCRRTVAPNRIANTPAGDQTHPGVLGGARGGNHRDRAPLATPTGVEYPPVVVASGKRRVGPPSLRRRVACGPCHAGSSGSSGRRGYACGDGSRAASCGVGPLAGKSSSWKSSPGNRDREVTERVVSLSKTAASSRLARNACRSRNEASARYWLAGLATAATGRTDQAFRHRSSAVHHL